MMPGFDCIIRGCNSNSWRTKDVAFFPVPSVNNYSKTVHDLTTRRRLGWIININRSDVTWENSGKSSIFVCSRHFISGKPASLIEETDPDWVPNLNLQSSSASDEMMKYRLSQIAPPRRNKRKGGRPNRGWTVKKRVRLRKRSYLPGDPSTPPVCLVNSSTESATESDSSHCSGAKDDEKSQNCSEIPVLNNQVRKKLFQKLNTYQSLHENYKAEPLAVLTTTFRKNNLVTWNCTEVKSGKLWFAETTTLEKMTMSKRMMVETVDGYSLYARAECERDFEELLNDMERRRCPYLEITCNSVKAVLHLDKFHCPGATRKCVEYNGSLVTPLELMKAACRFNPKDWKFHFKVRHNGSILGFLFDSEKLDFTDHDIFCTHFCVPAKEALLFELYETDGSRKEVLPDKCCLPFCRNSNPRSRDQKATYFKFPREKERCELWLQNIGLFQDFMEKAFAKIKEADLKLCSDHFNEDQFFYLTHGQRRHLKWQGVPTVFDNGIISMNPTWDENHVPGNENSSLLQGANLFDSDSTSSMEDGARKYDEDLTS